MKLIKYLATLGGIILYGAMAWGLTTYLFYSWFVVSAFKGAPDLNYYQCVGLSMCFVLLKGVPRPSRASQVDPEVREDELLGDFLIPWVVMVSGWLVNVLIVKNHLDVQAVLHNFV